MKISYLVVMKRVPLDDELMMLSAGSASNMSPFSNRAPSDVFLKIFINFRKMLTLVQILETDGLK